MDNSTVRKDPSESDQTYLLLSLENSPVTDHIMNQPAYYSTIAKNLSVYQTDHLCLPVALHLAKVECRQVPLVFGVLALEVEHMYGVRAALVVFELYTSPQYTNSYSSHSSFFCTHLEIKAQYNTIESHYNSRGSFITFSPSEKS